MKFISTYKGWLAPLFGIAGLVVALALAWLSGGSKSGEDLGVLLGGGGAALACWFIGKRLNNGRKDKVIIERATRQETIVRIRHTFLMLQLQYYAGIYVAITAFGLVLIGRYG